MLVVYVGHLVQELHGLEEAAFGVFLMVARYWIYIMQMYILRKSSDFGADEQSDALRETFILRKTSLTQDQWDMYLSPEATAGKQNTMDDSAREGSALLGRKSGLFQGSMTGDGAVTSRKATSFDVETGANTFKMNSRYHLHYPSPAS
jgi:hypothetical protein